MGNVNSVAIQNKHGIPQFVSVVRDREHVVSGTETGTDVNTAVVQIVDVTPANVEVDDVFTILAGGVAVATYTAVAATVQDVVEGLQLAWETDKAAVAAANPSISWVADVTATEDDTKVILTGDSAFFFAVTGTAVDGGGTDTQTITIAVSQGNSTSDITNSTSHILGTQSVSFDKTSGTVVYAGITLDIDSVDISRFLAGDKIETTFNVSAVTEIASATLKLGTDASNYNEFTIDDSEMDAGWNTIAKSLSESVSTGNGWTPSAIRYVEFYFTFDAITDVLADALLDSVVAKAV